KKLQGHIQGARIAPLFDFTVAEWLVDELAVMERLRQALTSAPWIVRSSCKKEDNHGSSNAGAYLSIPDVSEANLRSAIARVIASYGPAQPDDEVLVQPMLTSVVRSGVAFSHDPNTCSPYRIVNWFEGADTAAVTGGSGGGRTWQQAARSPVPAPPELVSVIALLEELLDQFDGQPVDCEFAITREAEGETLWLLQARPLVMPGPSECQEAQADRHRRIAEKVELGMRPHPFLKGRSTVYGVMPDWNPAEIVGIRPKPLALSLYRELVTDSIWAYQRHNYGYRNLRSFPLLLHFCGLPYIDVRLSFNSFVPADVEDGLADRLVDYYIDRLLSEPALHDKIEFEIVYSCYTLDLPERMKRLAHVGFSVDERTAIAGSLRRLTNRIVDARQGLWRADAAKLEVLTARREQLYASDVQPIEKIYWLLEDAKRYGTLPFAGLARAGFVAVQMLRSLVTVGVFSQADYDTFLNSVSTVSGQLARDRANMDKSMFLSRYGHLRPGTYDLLSPRYDEAPDKYFDWAEQSPSPPPSRPFSVTLPQLRETVRLLEEHDLEPDGMGLFNFLKSGIELRELSKFHFTKNLSDALVLIGKFGLEWGFSPEDMAFVDVGALKEIYICTGQTRDILARSIDQGKARYAETLVTALPPIIANPDNVWAFEWPETAPNYITQGEVTAKVAVADSRENLAGAIVCIPNADPGYDWLFSYPVAGLVTAWGGVNSHMAIRAGELGLPAVIGAGELLYRRWSTAKRLLLDCAGRRVEVLS
ncbi:MAG TPA: PEP-utilizing enzyme, partial [Prosthecobacter sp.]|nr:PEP-utilizing enzyme [Prosthecobacter sp.]